MAFGDDVGNAHDFEHCAHRTTSNDARTLGCRRHLHIGCTVVASDVVVDGAVFQRHFVHIATGFFHGLLHSSRHFFGFAFAHANAAIAITNHGECGVGMGKGKSKEVPAAVQKAMEEARRNMHKVSLKNGTIHHNVTGHHGAANVQMAPAPKGTGIIAGGPMRAVFEVMGITDIVAKSHGSSNPYNMVRATLDALIKSTTAAEVAAKRGKSVEDLFV